MYKLRYKLSQIHEDALVSTAKISPDGRYLATASSDRAVKIWNLATGELIRTLVGHTEGISDLEFTPNSAYIASCSDDMTIRIWNLRNGELLRILKGHTFHVNSIKFNHKGSILISGSSDENIRVWDVKRGKCLRVLSAHSDAISCVDFCFDASIIVSGSYDGLVRLFDLDTGQCLKTLIDDQRGPNFPITFVRFSPNAKYVLSSSLDGDLRLWDYMNNRVVKTYQGPNCTPVAEKYTLGSDFVIFNNQKCVVSGDETGHILFWDVQTKKIQFVLEGSSNNSPIMHVSVWNGGEVLSSVSLDGELRVWDYHEIKKEA